MRCVCGSAARVAFATAAALVAVAVIGASAAGSASGPVSAKHFFWSSGQDPAGTANAVANNIIYHGGNAGPRRDRRPDDAGRLPRLLGRRVGRRLHDPRHGREALLQQDAAELPQLVHGQSRRQQVGRRADAVLPQRARRDDELRRHRGRAVRHESEASAEGRLDRPDPGAGRDHRVRARRRTSSTTRSRWRHSGRQRTSRTTRTRRTSS